MRTDYPNRFSRRDLLRLSAAASAGLVLDACVPDAQVASVPPAATAALQNATSSAGQTPALTHTPGPTNSQTPTETLSPTKTQTPTGTPSPTNAPTSTITPKPTPTVTESPRPTPIPRKETVYFSRSFDEYLDTKALLADARDRAFSNKYWNSLHQDGGTVEIVDVASVLNDPALLLDERGNPRGKVMKCTIAGKPVQQWGTQYWRALYPDWVSRLAEGSWPPKTITAPCALEVDVFMPSDFTNNIGILSGHYWNERSQRGDGACAFEIYPDARIMVSSHHEASEDSKVQAYEKRITCRDRIRRGVWTKFRLEIAPDGKILPYINGDLALASQNDYVRVAIDSSHKIGLYDAHPGLQKSSDSSNDGFPPGRFILNDNFRVIQYRS